jgi:3-oxoacyl-[acyl-carrier-protein] synthase-3
MNDSFATLPRIIGTGWSVPQKVRYNNDPIFDWLRENHSPDSNLFEGYEQRHVLSPGETLIDIMVPAAQMALQNAGIEPADIDILLGHGSISEYIQPDMLSLVHKELGLPKTAWVIPVMNDYSNYASSLLIADALIATGRAKNILICIGGNWTTNVDYKTPQSISAADGAGAAVVSMSSDPEKWYVKDQVTITASENYGAMATKSVALTAYPGIQGYSEVFSPAFFQITEDGLKEFGSFGMITAINSVIDLLAKNNLSSPEIAFMPHQTSIKLIDYWVSKINPAYTLHTLKQLANLTVATHAINLAYFNDAGRIDKDNLVMMALGPDMHANAMLLKRG